MSTCACTFLSSPEKMASKDEPPKNAKKFSGPEPPSKEELGPFRKRKQRLTEGVTWNDLDVQELEVTSTIITTAAFQLGQYCTAPNLDFLECRRIYDDPRPCIQKGQVVAECSRDFFMKLRDNCKEPFTKFWTCMDWNDVQFRKCRPEQAAFDKCMLEKLGIEKVSRPKAGEV